MPDNTETNITVVCHGCNTQYTTAEDSFMDRENRCPICDSPNARAC